MAEIHRRQADLWNRQHAERGVVGPEGTSLLHVPNDAAIYLASILPPSSRILEIGSANGRDARYWASLNSHEVHCVDFSSVALDQMMQLAAEQNITHLITPHCHDVACGTLPPSLPADLKYSAFYARSALHLGDESMNKLAEEITTRINPNGIILIEGKSPNDSKIKKSQHVENNLVIDEHGHLRRIWTPEYMIELAKRVGWEICDIFEYADHGGSSRSMMLRCVANCT